jgi:hypothetical protein
MRWLDWVLPNDATSASGLTTLSLGTLLPRPSASSAKISSERSCAAHIASRLNGVRSIIPAQAPLVGESGLAHARAPPHTLTHICGTTGLTGDEAQFERLLCAYVE